MKLQLITLTGTKLDEDVYEVQIPTREGEISVFDGHQPLVTIADPGVLLVRKNKSDRDDVRDIYAIHGGAVQITTHEVKVLVDEADHADDIASAEAEAALERAREQHANAKDAVSISEAEAALERAREQHANAKDAVSISEAEALMNRAAVRLKVANLRRRHK
jgi:F-type H+-transporting ATPase subunit epsilon